MESNSMFPRNEADKQISELNKRATQFSYEDKWEQAIKCLETVWELMPNALMDHGAKVLVRLPKFLQQAGKFNEAKEKFNELIHLADCYAERVSQTHNLKEFYQPFCKELFLYEVYDAMRIAYKREKLIEQANNFKQLSDFHYQESQKYGEQLDHARKRMLEQHRKRHEEMRKKREEQSNFRWTPKF